MSSLESIAHYRITAKLGEGGMGAVYRATDTKLHRDVAIKVLPPDLAEDATRMQRFEREAQVLASLNHPNIAAIYGIEQGAIVMELVEGEDLHGPLPVDTVLNYARQIVEALEAAHEKGIIHRDLKPANIKITHDGVVKLLDFGLAKSGDATPTPANATQSPTLSLAMTQAGIILGTAAYMSPEQAKGKPVDKRADIWAFGVVLFELLTGRHPIGVGETVADTLAGIIFKEADLSGLPMDTPPRLRRLIARCLSKDLKMRLRDIGDARVLFDEQEAAPVVPAAQSSPQRTWLPWCVAAATTVLALAMGSAWVHGRSTDPGPGTMRFSIPLPAGSTLGATSGGAQWVPSPDGRSLAITVRMNSVSALWFRPLNAAEAHRLDNTEGAEFPFWSPDGQYIAFFAAGKLERVSTTGGARQRICDLGIAGSPSDTGDGGTWSKDGEIVFAPVQSALMRVSAAGGIPAPVTKLENNETSHSWPQFLPDGRHVLYLARGTDSEKGGIYVQELGSPTRVYVLKSVTRAMWAPPGYLLFIREGNLFGQRMNSRTFQLEGEPLAVAEDVAGNPSRGWSTFAVSQQNGVLAYRTGQFDSDRQITWRGRDGKTLTTLGKPGQYFGATLSPDETSAALVVNSRGDRQDVWVMDLMSGVLTPMTRNHKVVFGSAAVWSPDSKRLAVATSDGLEQIDVASANGTLLTKELLSPQDWTPDGQAVLCRDDASNRLSLVPLAEGSKVQSIITTPYRQIGAVLSPDGKFVTYTSQETGASETWVASFPSFSMKRRVSASGGAYSVWARDGKRLFYRAHDGTLMEVEIHTGSSIEIGQRRPLFQSGGFGRIGVSEDGHRFLTNEPLVERNLSRAPELSMVVNWPAEMK